jgi:hypothetical protein
LDFRRKGDLTRLDFHRGFSTKKDTQKCSSKNAIAKKMRSDYQVLKGIAAANI